MSTNPQYQLISELNITFLGDNSFELSNGIHTGLYNADILFFLDKFKSPTSLVVFEKALSEYSKGKQHTLSLFDMFNHLLKHGFISGANKQIAHKEEIDLSSWGNQFIHKKMLDDFIRTNSFKQALEKTVSKESVVLDIGTGTGILALFAAKQGAKKVYAVDSSSRSINYAKRMAQDNELSSQIEFIHASSFDVALPEKADILITEVIGNSPLGENIIEIILDAKKRLLKDNAIIIPHELSIKGISVFYDEQLLADKVFNQTDIDRWSQTYQLEFSGLMDSSINKNDVFFEKLGHYDHFKVIGEPFEIEKIPFSGNLDEHRYYKNKEVAISSSNGESYNAILVFFDAILHNSIVLSTCPKQKYTLNSWRYPIYPINNPDQGHQKLLIKKNKAKRARYNFVLN